MSLLEVSHLRKSYDGTVAVDDLSFAVEAGDIFGLLGPNGAGKTTTMMAVAGLLEADAGEIVLDGSPFESRRPERRRVLGVVPQELALYPDLSARENLDFFARLYGLTLDERRRRTGDVLSLTGLEAHADQLVQTFSGGMQRRLNFGIGLLHQPRVLILDEPTVGVDPQSRAHLLDCIRRTSDEGIAVVYASHYMEEVEALCDRVGIMDQGKMLACDRLEALLGRIDADVRLFVSGLADEAAHELPDGVRMARRNGGDAMLVVASTPAAPLAATLERILTQLRQRGAELRSIEATEANLERLFLELTGRRLRD